MALSSCRPVGNVVKNRPVAWQSGVGRLTYERFSVLQATFGGSLLDIQVVFSWSLRRNSSRVLVRIAIAEESSGIRVAREDNSLFKHLPARSRSSRAWCQHVRRLLQTSR